MIHLRSLGNVPKSFQNTDVYAITSRESIFGFHRTVFRPDVDVSCTKTLLLLASEQRVMDQILERINNEISQGYSWNRTITDNVVVRDTVPIRSMVPLSMMTMKLNDMEQLCWLHHFDMFIANSIDISEPVSIYGYEYSTWEPPNRGITEKYMRDMMYKNI